MLWRCPQVTAVSKFFRGGGCRKEGVSPLLFFWWFLSQLMFNFIFDSLFHCLIYHLRLDLMILEVFSNLNDSMILRFVIFSNDIFQPCFSSSPFLCQVCTHGCVPFSLAFLQLFSSSSLGHFQSGFVSLSCSVSSFQLLSFFAPVLSLDWLFSLSLHQLYFSLIA